MQAAATSAKVDALNVALKTDFMKDGKSWRQGGAEGGAPRWRAMWSKRMHAHMHCWVPPLALHGSTHGS